MENEDIKYFTKDELNKFFRLLDNTITESKTDYSRRNAIRNNAFFRTLYYCALRVTETTMLKATDYDELNNLMMCTRVKGGRDNQLKIVDNEVVESLKMHIRENKPKDYLFCNLKTNEPLSRKTVHVIMKNCCKDANIDDEEKWTPQTLRNTRAIMLVEKGFDINELQYWLGIINTANAMIYYDIGKKIDSDMYKKITENKGEV